MTTATSDDARTATPPAQRARGGWYLYGTGAPANRTRRTCDIMLGSGWIGALACIALYVVPLRRAIEAAGDPAPERA